MSSAKWWAAAGTFAGVVAVVVWASVAIGHGRPAAEAPRAAGAAEVTAAGMVASGTGWALTPERLLWTSDGGAGWGDLTPQVTGRIALRGADFMDRSRGWVVASRQAGPGAQVELVVSRTGDGGRSWEQASLAAANPLYADAAAAPAYVQFVDPDHGWILAKLSSSANFSVGELFATSDGGRTWSRRAAPMGEPVTFLDQQTGWMAGGVRGDELYITHDGGATWSSQQRPVAERAIGPAPPGASGTDFADPDHGWALVPRCADGACSPGNSLYATDDGGRSWHEVTP
jgi:photosystem II stability/assembly factor-like uncharacterized protein